MPRILAIDDKQDNLITVSALLMNFIPDCTVITSDSGAEGIKKAEAEQPDTILLDIQMPEMDGYETCQRLKTNESTKHIPVIMITAIKTDSQSRIKGLEIGADAFLAKPIDQYELVSQVKVALRIKKAEDALRKGKDLLEDTVRERTRALRESEEKYRLLTEQNLLGVIIIQDGFVKYVNKAASELTEYSIKEALDWEINEFGRLFHPDDLEFVMEQAQKKQKGAKNVVPRYSYRIITKSGKVKWVDQYSKTIIFEGKTADLITIIDITDRKQSEVVLRERTKDLDERVKELNCLYGISNLVEKPDISLEEISQGLVDLIPLSWQYPEITCSRMFLDDEEYKTENFKETNWKQSSEIFVTGKRIGVLEICYLEEKPEIDEGPFLKEERNLIDAITGRLRHVIERIRAREALRESEEKYRSMSKSIKDPVYMCSQDFRIEYMNPSMIQRTGYDATGEKCFKAVHELNEKCPWCMYDRIRQGEHYEVAIVSPKDNRSYHVSSSPVVHGDGTISKITVFKDTTDFKKLETQLQQAQKMEAIGTLAGGIAHDFNNILGGIIGYAELAKMTAPEGSNVIAYLNKMIKSSDRAADLIKQILTLSRQHKQKQRPVQVKHIVKEALELLRATLPTTIEIRKDVAKDTGVVNADPTQMHQVIMNLGTNAGHAMQEDGGVLEVSLANVELDDLSVSKHLDLNAGSYLRLSVGDTGHGMTPETMERIFDPYFTTKDTGEGTGLGLSVAHGIVKAHGGAITVYSELGKGTTFHVHLPVILELEREEKESEEPIPTGSESILFIDDEEMLLEIGSQILEQLGYEVVTKKSSLQALDLFRAEPGKFDLVITDMTMPHMTGDKLSRELMKIRPHIPVILCTGHSTLVLEEKAKDLGIRAFVMKPLVMRNLAETVRKVLDVGRGKRKPCSKRG